MALFQLIKINFTSLNIKFFSGLYWVQPATWPLTRVATRDSRSLFGFFLFVRCSYRPVHALFLEAVWPDSLKNGQSWQISVQNFVTQKAYFNIKLLLLHGLNYNFGKLNTAKLKWISILTVHVLLLYLLILLLILFFSLF